MKFKSEKGSITLYVLVALFFLLAIIMGRFVLANRNLKVQYDTLAKTKEFYEKEDKIYKVEPSTTPEEPSPSTTPISKNHEIYVFNKDAFNFFNGNSTEKRFYVYQSGLSYILDENSRVSSDDILVKNNEEYEFRYKLMSDITLEDSDANGIISSNVVQNLNFNDHLIFYNNSTSQYIFYNRSNGGSIEKGES